jgi:2-C-methyl-D-erythritol 4-phosphate cytidylyltransferase
MAKRLYVIIPAAGNSTRMGQNKLFMRIGGMSGPTVIAKTLTAFKELAKQGVNISAILVTNESNMQLLADEVASQGFDFVEKIVLGGSSRTESVYNGVQALKDLEVPPAAEDAVFIHDGARPLVDTEILLDGLNKLKTCDVCVAGVPLKNTVKEVAGDIVKGTPDRSALVEVQTPQCFKYDVLRRSYENAVANNIEATDDTALAELLGYKVVISKGSYRNIKITTPEDIKIAEALL